MSCLLKSSVFSAAAALLIAPLRMQTKRVFSSLYICLKYILQDSEKIALCNLGEIRHFQLPQVALFLSGL